MARGRPTDSPGGNEPERQEDTGESASCVHAEATKPGEGWLIYNGEYRSLICAFHGYAVCSLEGHLRDRHPDIDHRARSDIIHRHKGLQLQGPALEQLVQHGASNPTRAVKGLVVHRGFACTWPGCRHLTPSWKCLRVHLNISDGWRVRVEAASVES
jgi:hypothetical protein